MTVVVNLDKGVISGWCKAKDFKKQIEALKELTEVKNENKTSICGS